MGVCAADAARNVCMCLAVPGQFCAARFAASFTVSISNMDAHCSLNFCGKQHQADTKPVIPHEVYVFFYSQPWGPPALHSIGTCATPDTHHSQSENLSAI